MIISDHEWPLIKRRERDELAKKMSELQERSDAKTSALREQFARKLEARPRPHVASPKQTRRDTPASRRNTTPGPKTHKHRQSRRERER